MNPSLLALSTTISVLLAGSTAAANPINIVAARSVEIGTSAGPVFGSSSNATGAYTPAVSHPAGAVGGGLVSIAAAQDTLVNGASGVFSGTGSASVGYSVLASQGIYASSFFDVFFDLATPHGYTLDGNLVANDDGGFARARLTLTGPLSFSYLAIGMTPNTSMSSSGLLPAGTYRLVVEGAMDNGGNFQEGAAMGGESSFDFELLVTPQDVPVPEPATAAMLGFGLAWGMTRRARG